MVVVDLGGGGAEPVSVVEAKAWCRIERSDEDGSIAALVTAARETVERETRTVLVKRKFRVVLDGLPVDRVVRLPSTPLGAVTAIVGYDVDGTPMSLSVADAALAGPPGTNALTLSEKAVGAASNGIEIEFTAGFEAGMVPAALKLAVKQIVAASYEMRGAVAADMQPGLIPKAARDLIAPFRRRSL